jgi:AraC-like DNA-binding protein
MHVIFFHMDLISNAIHHFGRLTRRFPSAVPVDTVGYLPGKTSYIQRQFSTYNFSFILRGGGEYWVDGVRWEVKAPCVITQWPGTTMRYGPAGAWKEWEELFLIYSASRMPALKRVGLIRRGIPFWSIADIEPVRLRMRELTQLDTGGRSGGFVDRLDRICELMVVESILGEAREAVEPEERAILEIRDTVRGDTVRRHDFHELARRHGLSVSTFRRRWAEVVGVPPAHYVMRLRIEEACRLLVETRMKVGAIATSLGFSDPLYFSRRFRMETGVTAEEYRRTREN